MLENRNVSIFAKILLIILVLLYIYHISFNPLPYAARSRLLLVPVGLMLFFVAKPIAVSKVALKVFFVIISAILPIIITSIVNTVLDIWFIQNIVLSTLFFISSYGVIKLILIAYKDSFTEDVVVKYIVASVTFHNFLAVLGFLVPTLGSVMMAMQNQDENANAVLTSIIEFQSRIIGLGIGNFFTGGIVSSLGIMCCAYLISTEKRKIIGVGYIALFLFLSISGLFIARTSIVGILLSLCMLFFPVFVIKSGWRIKVLISRENRMLFIFIIIILILLLFLFLESSGLMQSSAFTHAFELFLNFSSAEGASTSSTDHMMDMYIFPEDIKTWVLGDGRFSDNGGYYMGTDVGYLRLIYYYGIFGMLFFFGQQVYVARKIVKYSTFNLRFKLLFFLMIGFILIINLKGIGDISYFLYLFLWTFILKRRLLAV